MTDQNPEPRALLSVEQAADVLGVSRSTMYEIIKAGDIETVKVGRLRRVPSDAIDAYVIAQTERGPVVPPVPFLQPRAPESKRAKKVVADAVETPEPSPAPPEPKPRKSNRDESEPKGTRAANGEGSVYLSPTDGLWHAWIVVGILDNGKLDRRHRKAKTEPELMKKVEKLRAAANTGQLPDAGTGWTVAKWLTYWVENIAAPTVRDTSADAYRNAVYKHLNPGVGAHRLDRIRPEHFEKLYQRMMKAGHSAGNAHQVHRTASTAFKEAFKRRYIMWNPAALAKPPRVEEAEIEPYEIEEAQKILVCAADRRNMPRWAVALVLGLRQGEALGLKWEDIDLDALVLRVRRNRLRPKYVHGCDAEPCGRKAGYCPQKVNRRKECAELKSRAGKRPMGIPAPLGKLLSAHRVAQDAERAAAGDLWADKGYVFATETGEPLNPNTDFHEWKDLLKAAGVREGRLHDARHTAATILLVLEVPNRTTQGLMGWSDPSMPGRYQHLVKRVRDGVAQRQGDLIWEPEEGEGESETGSSEPGSATETATPEPEE